MPKIITSDELKRWMKVGRSFVLLDVLTPTSFHKKHLPRAINASSIESVFNDKVDEIAGGKNTTIVIYGENGTQDSLYIAGIKLSHAGYEDVYEFKGGMNEWNDMGLPFETNSLISKKDCPTCV